MSSPYLPFIEESIAFLPPNGQYPDFSPLMTQDLAGQYDLLHKLLINVGSWMSYYLEQADPASIDKVLDDTESYYYHFAYFLQEAGCLPKKRMEHITIKEWEVAIAGLTRHLTSPPVVTT